MLYENYACGSDRNYTGYCDKEVDVLIERQSSEPDPEKRRQLVWEIERHYGHVRLYGPCRFH
jgi:peptide/nickel transport system substrate-binding protein